MSPRVADVAWVSSVASDIGRSTVDAVSNAPAAVWPARWPSARASRWPSREAALTAVRAPHAPQRCPGYQRPGTARERFRCPGCWTRYEHRAGAWRRLEAS